MAIPTGPASRPRKRIHEEPQAAMPPPAALPQPTVAHPVAAVAAPPLQVERPYRPSVRQSGRIPSEIFLRDALLSPAVLGLTLAEFCELLYQDPRKIEDLTVEEFFRLRDQAAWPDLFSVGDPRQLFTEDMCRRGQFVPIGWNSDGLSFATSKDEPAQDELVRALDMLVQLPVTLFTASAEAVDAGISWLYRR